MRKMTDLKVQQPSIIGVSTINHEKRVAMNLSCSEYVLMDFLVQRKAQRKHPTLHDIYRYTGFTKPELQALTVDLVRKGFVTEKAGHHEVLTAKWYSFFGNAEQEFDEFWKRNDRVFWTGAGSKKKALKLYAKARKKYSKEFLIQQRDHYAEYLEEERKGGFNRRVMMPERWLNPENEYYLTDWAQMAKELQEKREGKAETVLPKAIITEEERKKIYEQDSNQ